MLSLYPEVTGLPAHGWRPKKDEHGAHLRCATHRHVAYDAPRPRPLWGCGPELRLARGHIRHHFVAVGRQNGLGELPSPKSTPKEPNAPHSRSHLIFPALALAGTKKRSRTPLNW